MSGTWKRSRTLRGGALVAVGALIGAGGAAVATGDVGSETIHACVARSGAVRIVTGPSDCKGTEDPIAWNQVGPKGDAGPQGPAGATGPQGPQGPAGSAGSSTKGEYNSSTFDFGFTANVPDRFTGIAMRSEAEQTVHLDGFVTLRNPGFSPARVECRFVDAQSPGHAALVLSGPSSSVTLGSMDETTIPVLAQAPVSGDPSAEEFYGAVFECTSDVSGVRHVASVLQSSFVTDSTGN